jgi:indole-3-glycerol phosphate synthase
MILDDIVQANQLELNTRKLMEPVSKLKEAIARQQKPLDMASVLRGAKVKLIAEIKQASPSKGLICNDFDPERIARIYMDNGASAISILTETAYFKGSIDYLRNIRRLAGISMPLLRKDFIYDPYQIYEARANGADALLLIVAILNKNQLEELQGLARELGMQCLVEVHNEDELEIALSCRPDIIGINNRDLKTFNVDLAATEKLRPMIPGDVVTVSESGIKNRDDIEKLRQWKVDAVLIGESLMASQDIAAKMREFL